ncbi:hypothetical protein FGIG_01738 [Fasciola gigantica]|uniref:BHLH domain-containing protein n=1 Tax=Fasciola gigantica TaxID=46835 RepID=A0A504YWI4_FASGI|nr:hypothetical protein FGIG_01738 [Fasciola gigantica]
MQHFTRQTCLEAAIGDIFRQSGSTTVDHDALNNPSVIQQQYFYQKPVNEVLSSPSPYCGFAQDSGNEEGKELVTKLWDPKFPNPYSPDKSYRTNDTWLYETLYSNSTWNGQSVNRLHFGSGTEHTTVTPFHHAKQTRPNDSGAPQTDTIYSTDIGSGFSYIPATNSGFLDAGNESDRGFIYSTPLRSTDVEQGIKEHGNFEQPPTQNDPLYRLQQEKPNRERLPTRKQHQRVQDKIRTRALNIAFGQLRSCLPEIPKDTKLTKIRTLRTAITYIHQLMTVLDRDDSLTVTLPPLRTPRSVRVDLQKSVCCLYLSHPTTNQFLFLFLYQTPSENSTLRDSGYDSTFEKY